MDEPLSEERIKLIIEMILCNTITPFPFSFSVLAIAFSIFCTSVPTETEAGT